MGQAPSCLGGVKKVNSSFLKSNESVVDTMLNDAEGDDSFVQMQKKAFAAAGLKDNIELNINKMESFFKFQYDPTKQIKLKFKN